MSREFGDAAGEVQQLGTASDEAAQQVQRLGESR